MSEVDLSVVVPVYRGSETLPELCQRLDASLGPVAGNYELLFVDDASPDDSWSVLERLAAENPRVRAVQLMKNSGQQRAVLCGLSHARGAIVVTMDDDLQQRPEEVPLLVRALDDPACDVVIGRYQKKQHGLLRGLGTRAVRYVAWKTIGVPRSLEMTSFRAMRRRVVDPLTTMRSTNPVVGFLLYQVTHRIQNVDVTHEPRTRGRSTYSFRALVDYFFCMLMDYSDLPLRFVGYVGFLSSLVSAAMALFYLALSAAGRIGVSGFTTLILVLLFSSGLILMSLGIIGGYLIRILRAANVSSMFVVRRALDPGRS